MAEEADESDGESVREDTDEASDELNKRGMFLIFVEFPTNMKTLGTVKPKASRGSKEGSSKSPKGKAARKNAALASAVTTSKGKVIVGKATKATKAATRKGSTAAASKKALSKDSSNVTSAKSLKGLTVTSASATSASTAITPVSLTHEELLPAVYVACNEQHKTRTFAVNGVLKSFVVSCSDSFHQGGCYCLQVVGGCKIVARTRIVLPSTYRLPLPPSSIFAPGKATGLCLLGKIRSFDPCREIFVKANPAAQDPAMRSDRYCSMTEFSCIFRAQDDSCYETQVAVWGRQSNVQGIVGGYLMVFNAKQHVYWGNARFQVGDYGAIFVAADDAHTEQMRELNKFFASHDTNCRDRGTFVLPKEFRAYPEEISNKLPEEDEEEDAEALATPIAPKRCRKKDEAAVSEEVKVTPKKARKNHELNAQEKISPQNVRNTQQPQLSEKKSAQ